MQFLGVQIGNTWKMADDGRAHDLVMARLEKLQREQREVATKLDEIRAEIDKATIQRPTAEMVCASWGKVIDLWDVLTEEESAFSLQSLVENVDVQQKDRVLLRLSPIAEVHGQMLAVNSQMGAGVGLSSIYPPEPLAFATIRFKFKAFQSGRNRTKVPRPERRLA